MNVSTAVGIGTCTGQWLDSETAGLASGFCSMDVLQGVMMLAKSDGVADGMLHL